MMRHNSICRSHFVVLIFVVSTVVSLFLQTTISTTTTTTNSNNNNYDTVVDAFVGTSPPVLSPTNVCHSVFLRHDEERYSSVLSTTTRRKLFLSLDATTRRQSFGDLLGSTLALPALVDTASSTLFPLPANAADDYPFKLTVEKLGKAFPNAVTNAELITKVTRALNRYGYDEKTLVAFSLCSDEVNRPLEETFNGWYGEHFNLGGLAGFPFSGVTGYGAFASHIPDGGSCLLVYGPHVGIDSNGVVGKVDRKGKSKTSTCCGSAVAASRYVTAVYKGDAEKVGPPTDSVDAQQNYVAAALLPYGERIVKANDPMVELPFATYEPIDSMMQRIVGKVKTGGKVAMLGGLQINTPRGVSDYFLPLRFDIRDGKTGEIIEDLSWKRNVGTESRKRIT